MDYSRAIITAIRAILRNRMRAMLTSIGIIIGVSSVILMIGLGNSARIAVQEKVFSFGSNAMGVTSPHKPLKHTDIENLKRAVPQIKYISPVIPAHVTVRGSTGTHSSELFGVNEDYLKIRGRGVPEGQPFTGYDVDSMAKVAVIGTTLAKNVFGENPVVNETVVVNDVPFRVVGILESYGKAFVGSDFDDRLLVPFSTASAHFGDGGSFPQLYLSTKSPDTIQSTYTMVQRYLRKRHNIPRDDEDDFVISTSQEHLALANDISTALSMLLIGIASISLLVGGIGIMNIMLVSVTERTREIGIRMAIGAKRNDILMQFLIESVTLSVGGGIIGILSGLLLYSLIVYFAQWPFILSIGGILLALGFAVSVGVFFGMYPSYKASRLKPIEALKYE